MTYRSDTARFACVALALAAAVASAVASAVVPAIARAQGVDTLHLGVLQHDAERADRRAAQRELLAAQSALRLETLRAERLPALDWLMQAQYLSDVPTVGALLPGGVAPPAPPNDNYDARIGARQRLYDPTRAPRRGIERAELAESEARLGTVLFAQRQAVNDAFFAALLLDAQRAALDAGIADLEAQREVVGARVTEGVALPGDLAMLDAELLRRRQSRDALVAEGTAVRDVLGALTDREIPPTAVLAVPRATADEALARALARSDSAAGAAALAAGRPEHAQFDAGRALLSERRAAVAARDRPSISAFGRAGYGRPGLNPLAREFDSYWTAGVQLEWRPWDWGASRREREVLALQTRIIATEEEAVEAGIERALLRAAANIAQLRSSLVADDQIVDLHRRVLDEARLRFGEGVITTAEYVDRQTDLLSAELARETHRVQLAEARARVLTTLGLEVRE